MGHKEVEAAREAFAAYEREQALEAAYDEKLYRDALDGKGLCEDSLGVGPDPFVCELAEGHTGRHATSRGVTWDGDPVVSVDLPAGALILQTMALQTGDTFTISMNTNY